MHLTQTEETAPLPLSSKALVKAIMGPRLRAKKGRPNRLTRSQMNELASMGLEADPHSSNGLAGIHFHPASGLTLRTVLDEVEQKAHALATSGALEHYASEYQSTQGVPLVKDFTKLLACKKHRLLMLTCMGNLVLPSNFYFHIENPGKVMRHVLPLLGEYCLAILKENEQSCLTDTTLITK